MLTSSYKNETPIGDEMGSISDSKFARLMYYTVRITSI
jgi:hypothetical protein